ncbi:hypothetical protein HOE37_06735 [Candidatus Woesearchaeota archaeon]|jgi:hypothetical protein|nr:hypothetical protein [Candidatus Woesearchaeota archaeon]
MLQELEEVLSEYAFIYNETHKVFLQKSKKEDTFLRLHYKVPFGAILIGLHFKPEVIKKANQFHSFGCDVNTKLVFVDTIDSKIHLLSTTHINLRDNIFDFQSLIPTPLEGNIKKIHDGDITLQSLDDFYTLVECETTKEKDEDSSSKNKMISTLIYGVSKGHFNKGLTLFIEKVMTASLDSFHLENQEEEEYLVW